MSGMDEWQRKTNKRMAGPPDPDSPAALLNEIGRLRAIIRVNGLRWGHTHAEIDEMLANCSGDRKGEQ